MMHRAWSGIVEVPYCFSRSYVKFQGHTALKIVEFDQNWAFLDSNSSLKSLMAMKCCTKLETAKERCPIVFQGHPSNFKVTREKTSPISTQIGRFRTIGRSQLSNPSDLPCLVFVRALKTIGYLFYTTSSFMHHFVAIAEFKLELQSWNAQFGSKSTIFRAVWPWNLTDDLEKQKGTSPKHHQALCIIFSSYVNSNWSNSPETANWVMTSATLTLDLDLLHGHHFCHW